MIVMGDDDVHYDNHLNYDDDDDDDDDD